MNQCEIKIGNIFNSKRAALVGRFASAFNQAGDVEDALAKAFEFAASKLLKKEIDFDAGDFERLVCWKMRRLLLDAIAASQREHGRKSVKASAILDVESDDEYRVSIIEKTSLARYRENADKVDLELDILLQSAAIRMVFTEQGISERDYDLVDKILFCAADRKKLAAEKKMSVGNVNRVYCIWSNRLRAFAPEVRARYCELKERLLAA